MKNGLDLREFGRNEFFKARAEARAGKISKIKKVRLTLTPYEGDFRRKD